MGKIDPKLLLAFAAVVAFALYMQFGNPNKKYTGHAFWRTATVDDVAGVPDAMLLPGNKNAPVLFWAATATNNPKVIEALVQRGADVNESDTGMFSGTPLSGAAGYASNPAIIDELVRLGARIDKKVGSNDKTPLIIAAEINENPGIIERLVAHGADTKYRDATGRTALEQAKRFKNETAIKALEAVSK